MFIFLFKKLIEFNILFMSMMPLFFNNLIMIWLFMEMSMMMYFFLLMINNKKSMIYFIVQVFSSSIILIFMMNNNLSELFNWIFIISFMLKIGIYPMSWWIPNLIKSMSFNEIFYLNTLTKIPPMILFNIYMNLNYLLVMILFFNLMFSTFMNFKQNNFKKIMGYSSIFHSSLMLLMLMINSKLWLMYFIIYTITTFNLMKFLSMKITHKFYLPKNFNYSFTYLIFILMYANLPLFSFFSMKWILINSLLKNTQYMFISILILILSFLMMYPYFRMMYSNMFMKSKTLKMKKMNLYLPMYTFFSIFLWLTFMLMT